MCAWPGSDMAGPVSEIYDEIVSRLGGAMGWPDLVYHNRGRLAAWQDVAAAPSRVVANLLDGNPLVLDELISHGDPVVQYEQDCVVEFLVNELDDATRETVLDRAGAGLVEALFPVISSGGVRDLTLGGRCYSARIVSVSREGVRIDSTPGIAGFRARLALLLQGEIPGGESV